LKSRNILVGLIFLALLANTGFNIFLFYNLSKIYMINGDFRPDILLNEVQKKIESDELEIPPVEIFKFISADIYAKDYVMFTGKKIVIFLNLNVLGNLNDGELKALIAHEIGHYVLGHLSDRPRTFNGTEAGDLKQEKDADSFAAKYEGSESIALAISKLVWDENEKKTRLSALGVN